MHLVWHVETGIEITVKLLNWNLMGFRFINETTSYHWPIANYALWLLPPANDVWDKVMFSHSWVILKPSPYKGKIRSRQISTDLNLDQKEICHVYICMCGDPPLSQYKGKTRSRQIWTDLNWDPPPQNLSCVCMYVWSPHPLWNLTWPILTLKSVMHMYVCRPPPPPPSPPKHTQTQQKPHVAEWRDTMLTCINCFSFVAVDF